MDNQKLNIILENGKTMPLIGLGTGLNTDDQNMHPLIKAALDAGYRHFDTAIDYNNHQILGNAFQKIFSEGKYKREDLFITSKVLIKNDFDLEKMLDDTLKDLQMEYVDLFLIHWPIYPVNDDNKIQSYPHHVAWGIFESFVDKGKVKSIGVSNFNVQTLLNILSFCRIRPQNNQIELHPYLQQQELVQFCKRFNISVTAYSTLAHGGMQAEKFYGNKVDIWSDETLKGLAEKYKKSLPQIVLNYFASQNIIGKGKLNLFKQIVIPKTTKIARLSDNFDVLDFQISEEDLVKIRALDRGIRTVDPTVEGGMTDPNWTKTPIFH